MAYIVNKTKTPITAGLTSPTALLGAHQSGDLLIVWASQAASTSATSISGSGWTILCTDYDWSAVSHTIAYKIAASSSETGPTFTTTANQKWFVQSAVVRDAHATAPFGSSPAAGTDYRVTKYASASSFSSGAVTTTTNDCLVMFSYAAGGVAGQIFRPLPNAYRGLIKDISDFNSVSHCVGYLQQTTAGAVPTTTTYAGKTGSCIGAVISIRNKANGARQPDIVPNFSVLRWYGDHGARHDATTTWQSASNFATSIGTYKGFAINCSTSAPGTAVLPGTGDPDTGYGSATGLYGSVNASLQEAGSGAGIWFGGTHTVSSTDLSNAVFFVTLSMQSIPGTPFAPEGWIVVFSDGTNWAAYQVKTKDLYWGANIYYTFGLAIGNATAYASSGSINWAAVTRVGYFWHRDGTDVTSYSFYVRNAFYTKTPTVIIGGGASRPATFVDYTEALQSWGDYQFAGTQASAQALGKSSVQIGNGTDPVYFDGAASSFEFPPAFSKLSNRTIAWNSGNGSVSLSVKAAAGDTIKLATSALVSDTTQAFTLDAATSTSATYNFSGAVVVGLTPTWKTEIPCSSVAFSECGEIDAKGSDWTDCTITKTVSTDAAIVFSEDGGSMTRCTIDVRGTSAAYHLELGTATTAITLTDVTFTGTPGTDKIHVKKTTGTVTITASGTTSIVAGDVTSDGATVSIVAPTIERGQNFTGLVAGSKVKVFTTGTQTVLYGTDSSGTSFAWDDATAGDITVDYTIQQAGYLPIRVTGITLTGAVGTGQIDTPITQVVDRAYVASSGLTYGTTAVVTVGTNPTTNPGTKTFQLATASTGQNWYSFWIEQWIDKGDTGEALANVAFPITANGPNSFTLNDGWTFSDGATSIAFLSRDGLRYLNTSDVLQKAWAAILTSGVPAGAQVRYQQTDGGTTTNAANTGEMDQLVQIYDVGVYDYRGYLVLKVQEQGYDQVEANVVTLYGNLEDQLYVVGLTPLANGVATGDPALTITITDHGASPVTWNGKAFSITITDNATPSTGTNIMRELRYNFDAGGTYQGKNAFNWHDLVQTNGTEFKTVRGIVYGDVGATLKGVRVVTNGGTDPHPDFNLFTADDGTTYSPPVVADVSVTGMPTAAAASRRLQLIHQTAISATAWQATTAYAAGALRKRTAGIGTENTAGLYLRCTTAGTSAGVEPTWNTTPGGTTNDGTAVWTTYKVLFYDADPASASYTTTYTDGNEFVAGETVEIRFAEMDAGTSFKRYHTTAITTSSGFSFVVNEEADSVYATNGLNGSSYESTFSPNFTNNYIVLDSNTDFAGTAAYAYFCYTLTSSNGMYKFWDGVTAIDEGNYRIEVGTLNLYFDESNGFVKQTDNVRIFRSDGTRPALDPTTGGAGIEINWRVPVNVVTTGGSALTPAESSHLLGLANAPSSPAVATAVRTELSTELARIDTTVSSRLATAGYTTPPSASTIATEVLAAAELAPISADVAVTTIKDAVWADPKALTVSKFIGLS